MSLLALSELSFEFPSVPTLFGGGSRFPINPADRLAVVGPNGSGKSTLLRLIVGDLEPASGFPIARQRGLRIAMADQEIPAENHQTLFDYVFTALPSHAQMRAQMRELEERLNDPPSGAEYASLVNDLRGNQAGSSLKHASAGRSMDWVIPSLIWTGMCNPLSGGERTRATLAKALSIETDLLVLDEPTSHLDIEAREWLEATLASNLAACVITSHDRALLTGFAERVVEIECSKVRVFEGGYSEYRQARALLDRQAWDAYGAFERRKAAMDRAAERRDQLSARVAATPEGIRGGKDHYARKAAKVARTGRILRERVEGCERVEKPWEAKPIEGLGFDHVTRAGDIVLAVEDLTQILCRKNVVSRSQLYRPAGRSPRDRGREWSWQDDFAQCYSRHHGAGFGVGPFRSQRRNDKRCPEFGRSLDLEPHATRSLRLRYNGTYSPRVP